MVKNFDGKKIIRFNNKDITIIINNNSVSNCSHWELIYELSDAGYFTMDMDRHGTYGHCTFYITQKFLDEEGEKTRWVKGQDGQWYEIDSRDRDWHFGESKEERDRLVGIQYGQLCPACSSKKIHVRDDGLRECECKAIFNTRYEWKWVADALTIINLNNLSDESHSGAEYFDLFLKYHDGNVKRVHGWYNPKTKNVVQFG